jgi:hypothetical protein
MLFSDPLEQVKKLQDSGKGSKTGSITECVAKNGGWGSMIARTGAAAQTVAFWMNVAPRMGIFTAAFAGVAEVARSRTDMRRYGF